MPEQGPRLGQRSMDSTNHLVDPRIVVGVVVVVGTLNPRLGLAGVERRVDVDEVDVLHLAKNADTIPTYERNI